MGPSDFGPLESGCRNGALFCVNIQLFDCHVSVLKYSVQCTQCTGRQRTDDTYKKLDLDPRTAWILFFLTHPNFTHLLSKSGNHP